MNILRPSQSQIVDIFEESTEIKFFLILTLISKLSNDQRSEFPF